MLHRMSTPLRIIHIFKSDTAIKFLGTRISIVNKQSCCREFHIASLFNSGPQQG